MNTNEKIDTIVSEIKSLGKIKFLSKYADICDKSTYFSIKEDKSDELNITKKGINYILPLFAYFDDPEFLADCFLKLSDKKEKHAIRKIDRLSNIDDEQLNKNLMKTIVSGNLDFSKRYGKEKFLRDRIGFFNLISKYVLLGKCSSLKSLMVFSFMKLTEGTSKKDFDDNIFYLFMSYITRYRDCFYEDMIDYDNNINIKDIDDFKDKLEKEEYLNKKDGFDLYCYLKLLDVTNNTKNIKLINNCDHEIQKIQKKSIKNELLDLNEYDALLLKKI